MLVLVPVVVPASVILILGLACILRADRADIPAVAKAIGRWLRGGSG